MFFGFCLFVLSVFFGFSVLGDYLRSRSCLFCLFVLYLFCFVFFVFLFGMSLLSVLMTTTQFSATFIEVTAALPTEAVVSVRSDCILPPPASILTALVLDHQSRSMAPMVA